MVLKLDGCEFSVDELISQHQDGDIDLLEELEYGNWEVEQGQMILLITYDYGAYIAVANLYEIELEDVDWNEADAYHFSVEGNNLWYEPEEGIRYDISSLLDLEEAPDGVDLKRPTKYALSGFYEWEEITPEEVIKILGTTREELAQTRRSDLA